MSILFYKFKEVVLSLAPVVVIVLLLHFFLTPLTTWQLLRFLIGSIFVIIGLSIFLVGIDLGISPFADRLGETIAKSGKIRIVALAGLLLGFFISMAEPSLHILASEISVVTDGGIDRWILIIVVSAGISLLVSAGLIRILYNTPLYIILTVLYIIIFLLSFFVPSDFLAIAFDASGATTGAMAVPFLLSLALGIAKMKKDGKSSEKDSFGLVAIASAGAIIAVQIMSLFADNIIAPDELSNYSGTDKAVWSPFINEMLNEAFNSLLSIAPLFIIFLVCQLFFFSLKRKFFIRISRGFYYAWIGLVIFMAGVNAGFMEVGREIGSELAAFSKTTPLVVVGFILGLSSVLAEPAVHVLTQQIEEVTSGSIRRISVLMVLALGVGIAIALSVLRILIPAFELWHILLPGYIIAVLLSHVGSKLFVGISFDAGGVASGPMTATFILAYMQGAANATEGANILIDGFGVIALVALTPILTLQVLGLMYRRKSLVRSGVDKDDD